MAPQEAEGLPTTHELSLPPLTDEQDVALSGLVEQFGGQMRSLADELPAAPAMGAVLESYAEREVRDLTTDIRNPELKALLERIIRGRYQAQASQLHRVAQRRSKVFARS